MHRTERLLNLFAFLLNSARSRSASDIRDSVPQYAAHSSESSFRRSLGRDVQTLRQAGVPVEVDSESRYRVSPRAYHLPALEFSEKELDGLALASRIVSTLAPSLQEAADSALRKLAFGNWDSLHRAEENEADLEFRLLRSRSQLIPEDLAVLLNAVLNRRTIRIRYRARSTGQTTLRDVDPYGLAIHEGQWYLVGFCHLRGDIRTFKGVRIAKLEMPTTSASRKPAFAIPEGFALEKHVSLPRWRRPGNAPPFAAKVWFDKEVWWWAKENWGAHGAAREEPQGGTLEVEVGDADAFLRALLELGIHAEVKAPERFRGQAVAALERIVEAHS
jgi:proteasome accessory factor B